MKYRILVLLSAALLTGCATTSTIQSREQEQAAAYAALPPNLKTMVEQGRITAGMPSAAVYIAWGRPNEVLQSGTRRGEFTTWVYRGSFLEETRYWIGRRNPYLAHDYEPRTYVRAEVIFANDRVQSWRTLPQPAY